MRNTRALIAGLGTTGSMVAAAACVFLVASAVIAFKGWPGTGFADRVESLFVNDSAPVAWDQPGTAAVAASAGAAAAAVTPTAVGPTFGPGVVLDSDGTALAGAPVTLPDGTIVPGGAGGAPVAGGAGGGGPGEAGPAGDVRQTAGDTVRRTGSDVGNTVRDTTGSLGGSVGGPAGDAVTQTGSTLGDTVDGAAGTAGDIVGGD